PAHLQHSIRGGANLPLKPATHSYANTTYFYRVTATNTVGTSCGSNEIKSIPVGESQCGGLQEVIDPAGDQKSAPANADLDVIEVRVANVISGKEKISGPLSTKLPLLTCGLLTLHFFADSSYLPHIMPRVAAIPAPNSPVEIREVDEPQLEENSAL